MLEFILLFFPTFFSLDIIKKQKNLNYKDVIVKYPLYNILINGIAFFMLILFKKSSEISFESLFSIGFCAKYLALTLTISIILPFVTEFISKNFEFDVKIKRNKNNEKAHK